MSTILLTDFCRVVVDHPEVRIERAHTVEPLDAMGRPSKRAGETVWRVVGYYADIIDVRDEYLEELNEIRHLLGAGPGVTALEAVKQAQKEIAEARSEANRCFAEHESMRRARDAAKRDLSAAVDTIGAIGEALSCGLGEAVLDAAARVARERDEEKARVYALTTERDEEKARRLEAERELELARVEAEAKPSQAACRLRKERDEAKALAQTEVTRASRLAIDVNTLRRHLDEARAALVQTRRDFSAAAEMRDKWSTRVAELETAIRTLGKVLQ